MCDALNDLDYVRGELADIQAELNAFPPSSLSSGVMALTEKIEGLEARVGEIEDAFLRLRALAAVLPR